MKIFLICPVRNANSDQIIKMQDYVSNLEHKGHIVYYPARDNQYENTDSNGYIICEKNKYHILDSDEIHIFWDSKSQGSLFDLGVAFGSGKPLIIANYDEVETTVSKSFANMIKEWSKRV